MHGLELPYTVILCAPVCAQVESKIDSAGLALWADIEQPPGSLPPDCVNFLQQALTKDPRQRPSAEQMQGHPWIAR
jgi:serine/threonine protein kinase